MVCYNMENCSSLYYPLYFYPFCATSYRKNALAVLSSEIFVSIYFHALLLLL